MNIPIDTITLTQYLENKFGDSPYIKPNFISWTSDDSKEVVNELHNFGLSTIQDLDKIIPEDLKNRYEELRVETTFARLVRQVMVINDLD